ncbi:hypothetical protein ACH5RR_039769 [Cinchona calisaya]|uniref:Uncharacterized protein n=1 Tax=Cinchona calisaya TaxID=153742 RepID=A0ABD2XZ85_9GENT
MSYSLNSNNNNLSLFILFGVNKRDLALLYSGISFPRVISKSILIKLGYIKGLGGNEDRDSSISEYSVHGLGVELQAVVVVAEHPAAIGEDRPGASISELELVVVELPGVEKSNPTDLPAALLLHRCKLYHQQLYLGYRGSSSVFPSSNWMLCHHHRWKLYA